MVHLQLDFSFLVTTNQQLRVTIGTFIYKGTKPIPVLDGASLRSVQSGIASVFKFAMT